MADQRYAKDTPTRPAMDAPVRILLVEDNPGDARLIREDLRDAESFRFELIQADRLATARAALADSPVDVVLLDLSLPDAHGLDTVLQTIETAPESAIVVMTGLDDERVAVQAVQAGAQDYLVKGRTGAGLLVRSIRYAVERKRLDRERLALLRRAEEARMTAEAAVRGRDEVLRIVSHDLGNSLSAVGIHAMLLERGRRDAPENDDARERARSIRELVAQMHRLRQDLLDAASIEAGRLSMHPQPHPVEEILTGAREVIGELYAEKELRLEIDASGELPIVYADRQRLLQVLSNLLGNAAKFTPPGGTVSVGASPVEGGVRFSVSDTGTGIAPEHLPHLFDRFWRASGVDRQGAGLGLAIAKGIVEAHGGEIGVTSEPGVGTTFHFTVPRHPPAGEGPS